MPNKIREDDQNTKSLIATWRGRVGHFSFKGYMQTEGHWQRSHLCTAILIYSDKDMHIDTHKEKLSRLWRRGSKLYPFHGEIQSSTLFSPIMERSSFCINKLKMFESSFPASLSNLFQSIAVVHKVEKANISYTNLESSSQPCAKMGKWCCIFLTTEVHTFMLVSLKKKLYGCSLACFA